MKSNSPIIEDESINNRLVEDTTIYANLSQEVIITTEDKIWKCLKIYLDKISRRNEWQTPLGIAITIGITLLTTDFKDFIFKADTWTALFIFGLIISLIWLFRSFNYLSSQIGIEDIINDLKKGSPIEQNNGHTHIIKDHKTVNDSESLFIVKATYGKDDKLVEVTNRLRGLVTNGKLMLKVTNVLLVDGKDPAPGIVKSLNVEYLSSGKMMTKKVDENSELNIP